MLDESEGVAVGVLGAGEERLTPRFGLRIDDWARKVSFEDVTGDLAAAAPRAPGLARQPTLQVSSESYGDDGGDVGGFRHLVYSIHRARFLFEAELSSVSFAVPVNFASTTSICGLLMIT